MYDINNVYLKNNEYIYMRNHPKINIKITHWSIKMQTRNKGINYR